MRLAVGEEFAAGDGGASIAGAPAASWLQFLPHAPERARQPDLDPGDVPEGMEPHVVHEDDAWVEGRTLVGTVEDVELIDPAVSAERLLYRLFHERGVRVFRASALSRSARARGPGVENMLQELPAGRPRPHGRERQDHGDLRVLQLDLRVRAGRGARTARRLEA